MAIQYRLYQEKREVKYKGKWYARAVSVGTVDLDKLAEVIQENVSVKKSDVYGVLIELVNVMKSYLQESYAVNVNGLGIFRVGLATLPAETAAAFNTSQHVRGMRINFLPEGRYLSGQGMGKKKTTLMLAGSQVKELPVNTVEKG